jgi:NADPH-dependent curcumin reductase CurA
MRLSRAATSRLPWKYVAPKKELGVTKAFNYKTQDWAAEIQSATSGAGVDVIVDSIFSCEPAVA